MKTAILLITHFFDKNIADIFHRIRAQTLEHYDVFITLNRMDEALNTPSEAQSLGSALFLCNHSKLLELPYPVKCKPEGWSGKGWQSVHNADTILLSFFRDHPGYDYYWGIEYDVHFEGQWGFLFEHFAKSPADLLGTTLRKATAPLKALMPPFRDPHNNPPYFSDVVIGFYAIYRVSNRFLHLLDEDYQKGWDGHYEHMWGTTALRHGLHIEDIGGTGHYVQPHNKNRFYFNTYRRWDTSPGTFVFRPVFTKVHKRENTLWHPVKPPGNYSIHYQTTGWHKQLRERVKRILYDAAIRLWFRLFWQQSHDLEKPC